MTFQETQWPLIPCIEMTFAGLLRRSSCALPMKGCSYSQPVYSLYFQFFPPKKRYLLLRNKHRLNLQKMMCNILSKSNCFLTENVNVINQFKLKYLSSWLDITDYKTKLLSTLFLISYSVQLQNFLHSFNKQAMVLHSSLSPGYPSHCLPPLDGGGESHDLERVRFPTPHWTGMQFDHSLHADQTPLTLKNYVYKIVKIDAII